MYMPDKKRKRLKINNLTEGITIVDDPKYWDAIRNDPFFKKKHQDAIEFIKKHPLPERLAKR